MVKISSARPSSRGAIAIIKNKSSRNHSKDHQRKLSRNVYLIEVPDTKRILGKIVQRFYKNSSKNLKTIGVTGTNGKTTITYFIEMILQENNITCGLIGTINSRIGDEIFECPYTTPSLIENHQFMNNLVQQNVPYCVMEVSSHALSQGRVDLIDFKTVVFTNLTDDHLDYHGNMENYFLTKSKLFKELDPHSVSIINHDDEYGRRLLGITKSKIMTYGIKQKSDVMAENIKMDMTHTEFYVKTNKEKFRVKTHLIGLHNIYNILAAISVGLTEGIDIAIIQKGIETLRSIPGRLQRIECHQEYRIFIDYAHTEDGLKNVLQSLKDVTEEKLIVVFGCGGDRDKTKREKMGEVASLLADYVIVTSDNPRNEDPQSIIDSICKGCKRDVFAAIIEREEAVKHALKVAQKGDVVLIAGKGHEDYQIFKNQKIHFSDQEIVEKFLAKEQKV